jgi:UTP--glucose-1-phosphate uridylyltransferase
MNVTTAVIFAAGYGTRMLPITSAVEKELLPILDRPVIDYVVTDCVAAGIKRIIFVIRPGSHALQDYYLGNADLQRNLRRQHKTAALDQLRAIHDQANFEFVEQPDNGRYGTAVPLQVAAAHLRPNEAFVVCAGDDAFWHPEGLSETAAFIRTFESDPDRIGAIAARTESPDQLYRYGVLSVAQRQGREYLSDLIEKPAPGHAPSHLVNVAKYIFTPAMLPYVHDVSPNPTSGEYYLTDAVAAAAQNHPVLVHHVQGQDLDAGNVASWLRANQIVAAAHPDLKLG